MDLVFTSACLRRSPVSSPSFVFTVTFTNCTTKWIVLSLLPFHLVATDESANVTLSEIIIHYRLISSPFLPRSTPNGMDSRSSLLSMRRSGSAHTVAPHLPQHIPLLSLEQSFIGRGESHRRRKPAVSESEGCAPIRRRLHNTGTLHRGRAFPVGFISWVSENQNPSFYIVYGEGSPLWAASGRSPCVVGCSVSGRRWWRWRNKSASLKQTWWQNASCSHSCNDM